jgi:hypothetical protein
MVDELEEFLLSEQIFWPLGGNPEQGQPPFPNLSVGQLQLTLKELEAVEDDLTFEQTTRWTQLRDRAWVLRSKWTTAMAQKSLAESSTRVNLWRAYLNETKEAGGTSGNYPYEVRHRVILELLSDLTEILDDDLIQGEIKALDGMLRGMLSGPSGFIWDEPLSKVYPEDTYWFLYRRPPHKED